MGMNLSSLLGFLIAGFVLYFGVIHGAKDPAIFLDSHALLLVIGGTLAATLIAFPLRHLFDLGSFLSYGVLLKMRTDPVALIEDIRRCYQIDQNELATKENVHPFLIESLFLWKRNYLNREELEKVLHSRRLAFKKKYQQDAKILNAVAKYPPAFGLLGASTGMIAMMTNLGGPGGTEAIGAAMAIALVATFWGIAAANFVLLPLADYAQRVISMDQEIRELIIDGVLMIVDRKSEAVLVETLRSRLKIDERYKVTRNVKTPLYAVTNFNSTARTTADPEATVISNISYDYSNKKVGNGK